MTQISIPRILSGRTPIYDRRAIRLESALFVFVEPERWQPAKSVSAVRDAGDLRITAPAPNKLAQWRAKIRQRRAALNAWENEGGRLSAPPRKS